jgi:hypothetical protein
MRGSIALCIPTPSLIRFRISILLTWSGPMLYDSINVYSEAQERNGKLQKALTRLTVGYIIDSSGRPAIYSLSLKVL